MRTTIRFTLVWLALVFGVAAGGVHTQSIDVAPGAEAQNVRILSVADYEDKVYASWLGQIVGNIAGLVHENKYIDEPGPDTYPFDYGPNLARLQEADGAFSDDDTDIEYMYLLQMEQHGIEPTYVQLADAWKHHIRDRIWVANRTALQLMHFGYDPPVTGMQHLNSQWYQIDPQLVNEIWAVTAPGMVRYAAEKSDWAARITNDGWGVEPTVFYGAMYAAAFFESDVHALIDLGIGAMPEGSRFVEAVEAMKALHRRYPDDWKAARAEMARAYYHDERDDVKSIWNANLNGAAGILALLYGGGDFQHTLDMACVMGFDADNQAATMAGLLGVALGTEGLPDNLLYPVEGWDEPFNDVYKNVSRYDMPDASLRDIARRTAAMGERVILAQGGSTFTEGDERFFRIDPSAGFVAPLELPRGPAPSIEIGQAVEYDLYVTGGQPPYRWAIVDGALPDGLRLDDGRLSGAPRAPGVSNVTIEVRSADGGEVRRSYVLVARDLDIAPLATSVQARVTDSSAEVVYQWDEVQSIGLVEYHAGGGWFNRLTLQSRGADGEWQPIGAIAIHPPLPQSDTPYDKSMKARYVITFAPVQASAIRLWGDVVGDGWRRKVSWERGHPLEAPISHLKVHGALPGYESLARVP